MGLRRGTMREGPTARLDGAGAASEIGAEICARLTPLAGKISPGAALLSNESESPRPFPRGKTAATLEWMAWLFAIFALLTNGYFLSFLEPVISRGALVAASLVAAIAFTAAHRFGLPSSREARLAAARSAAVPAILLAILTLAFGLRLSGISYGLPQSYVSDEYDYVASALTRLKRGDFNPRWWHYPSLQPYLCSATYLGVFFYYVPQGRWSSIQQVVEEDMLYWGRFLSVAFGTAAVGLTFLLGRHLYGTRVGLMAAALLSVFPGVVEHSQYNKPDALLYFTVVASILVTLLYFERRGVWRAVASGVAIGFVVSSKYNGVLVVIPFLLAVGLALGRRIVVRPDLYAGLGAAGLTFLLLNPFFLPDLPRALDHIASEIHSYAVEGRPGAEGENNWWNHARYTAGFGAGLLPALFGLLGLTLLLRRPQARAAIFLSFPVAHYAHYSAQKINWPGNLIPVFPFLAIAAAYAANEIVGAVLRRRFASGLTAVETLACAGLVAVMGFSPLLSTRAHNERLNLPDAGNVAREWIDATFPPGTAFAVERHAPVPDRSKFPVFIEARIAGKSLSDYRELGVQYLVVSSMVYERFGPNHRITRAYEELFRSCTFVKEFRPVEGKLQGPTIRVLGIPAGPALGSP
jgi:4-amino-4-deoxy-L-arabinose transferase-like glycosyltransferase